MFDKVGGGWGVTVIEKVRRNIDLMELGTDLQDRPYRTNYGVDLRTEEGRRNRSRKYDVLEDYEAFVLSVGRKDMLEDGVSAETNSPASADGTAVPADYPRCTGCGRFAGEIHRPITNGTVSSAVYENCSTLLAYQPAGMTKARLNWELDNIRSRVWIVDEYGRKVQWPHKDERAVNTQTDLSERSLTRQQVFRMQAEQIGRKVHDAIAMDLRKEALATIADIEKSLTPQAPTVVTPRTRRTSEADLLAAFAGMSASAARSLEDGNLKEN